MISAAKITEKRCAPGSSDNIVEPFVSVLILNFNGKRFLNQCLGSISRQLYTNYEIVLIDNNSSDDSVNFVAKTFPHVKILKNKQNLGFAEGNNVGFSHSKGKYFIVLNTDTEVPENFISELVKVAESSEKIGSVSCKIVRGDGLVQDGPVFTNHGFIVPWLFFIHGFQQYQVVCNEFNFNLGNCATATLYRRSLIDEIGGFDPDFWAGWEDFDLGYRISLSGMLSVHTPSTTVFHVGSGSFKRNVSHETRCLRNRFFTLVKNYETKNLITCFFPFVFLFPFFSIFRIAFNEILFSLRVLKMFDIGFIAQLDFQNYHEFRSRYLVFFIGYLSFLKRLPVAVSKRANVQKLRTVSDDRIFSRTNVKSLL